MTPDQVDLLGKALGSLLTSLGKRLETIETQLSDWHRDALGFTPSDYVRKEDVDKYILAHLDEYVLIKDVETLVDERVERYIDRNLDVESLVRDVVRDLSFSATISID